MGMGDGGFEKQQIQNLTYFLRTGILVISRSSVGEGMVAYFDLVYNNVG